MNTAIDISNTVLKTDRLTLRPWAYSDLDDFFAYASVDGVGQMAGWIPHANREESRAILERFVEGKKTFALEYQGKVIGSLGIEEYNEEKFPGLAEKRCREIGYVLGKPYWGQGLMPEAVYLLGALANAVAVVFLALIALFPAKYPYEGASAVFDTLFGFEALSAPQPWQILLSSTVAYIVSGIVNALVNGAFGKLFKKKPDGKAAFYFRSYVSTIVGQFVANFVFAALAFALFAPFYTLPTLIGISVMGALLELLCEVIFSPVGYRICVKWQRDGVGKDYLEYCRKMEIKKDPSRIDFAALR